MRHNRTFRRGKRAIFEFFRGLPARWWSPPPFSASRARGLTPWHPSTKSSSSAIWATEWHRVTFNGRLAEIVGQYLRKGSQIYVEGSLRTRKWTDQSGVEKYTTEIRADQMQMLGSRQGMGAPSAGQDEGGGYEAPRRAPAPAPAARAPMASPQRPAAAPNAASGFDDMDDDIPF